MNARRIDVVWGVNGIRNSVTPIVVIVDVLSFSSAVDAACRVGAAVYPFKWRDDRVDEFAGSVNARVAVQRQDAGEDIPSLSPPSLLQLGRGDRLVLPSPNGSSLSTESKADLTIAGCLRNAQSVANVVNEQTGDVTIVAAGERWPDESLRPALEDLIGAGAIAAQLNGELSEDARAAQAVFNANVARLDDAIVKSMSGQELSAIGFLADVRFACEHNVSRTVPILIDSAYRTGAG